MSDEKQLFCPYCNRNVLAKRKATSNIFHFFMTMITCGIWLVIWIGQSIKFGGWRCAVCGSTKLEAPRP